MRDKGGGCEAYIVAGNPRGYRQGVGGGVESPQGIDTPEVDGFPWGDKTPGVATKSKGVTREDGRGRVGDGNPLTTRVRTKSRSDGGNEGMARGPKTAPPPRLQR